MPLARDVVLGVEVPRDRIAFWIVVGREQLILCHRGHARQCDFEDRVALASRGTFEVEPFGAEVAVDGL